MNVFAENFIRLAKPSENKTFRIKPRWDFPWRSLSSEWTRRSSLKDERMSKSEELNENEYTFVLFVSLREELLNKWMIKDRRWFVSHEPVSKHNVEQEIQDYRWMSLILIEIPEMKRKINAFFYFDL